MKRLTNLDYLRGLAALGIMFYHYKIWTSGLQDSSVFLGRVGVYGVSIFYILSGLTLNYVYANRMKLNPVDLGKFYKKRILRIFPLLWLVTFISLSKINFKVDVTDLMLNLTGLFGFVKWDKTFSTGVWSIGNELVFYSLFPLLIYSLKYKKMPFFFLMIVFLIFGYFSFYLLNDRTGLVDQWHVYSNPLNQFYLFVIGFYIPRFFENTSIKNWQVNGMIIIGILTFSLYPMNGNLIHAVTGWNRIIMSLSCVLICIGLYKAQLNFSSFIHKPLVLLGEASYSVYLLHPIVYMFQFKAISILSSKNIHLPTYVQFGVFVTVTLCLSYFVYNYFEKFFMKLGKR